MKPFIHAKSSARKFGGVPEDYLVIHDFLDSSKAAMPDNRHRALTHNSWFIKEVIERVFGFTLINADGKEISTRAVAEQHILEDMHGTIPTAADYLAEMEYQDWMGGAGYPPSHRKIGAKRRTVFIPFPTQQERGSKEIDND
jgi:hypothetical protein